MCKGRYYPTWLLVGHERREGRLRCLRRKRWYGNNLQMAAWYQGLLVYARSQLDQRSKYVVPFCEGVCQILYQGLEAFAIP